MQLDVAAMQKGLPPIVVFKIVEEHGGNIEKIACELYLDKIFIHSSKLT